MPLLKSGTLIDDSWTLVGDDDPLPGSGGVIVSAERWAHDRRALQGRNAPIGLDLPNDRSPLDFAHELTAFSLIRLTFPAFTDGRAYSSARLLRERLGFTGEIRASGQVLRDQYPLMLRCGFDAFEVAEGIDPAAWQASAKAISGAYQPAADDVRAIWALRHGNAA